jgi:zinc protease
MKRPIILMYLIAFARIVCAQDAELDIPFEEFYLNNGLRVIVHEDRKAPIVAVTLWYHVGSRNEVAGKTGFAHLFEHLMFNGSENYNDEYFAPFQQVGATSMNGTTNSDRTNYFQTVPTTALDLAMWMESDRMGHLLGAIDQEKLDEQRGVVQNEKRQRENQPYGRVFDYITENVFPSGHPYSWTTIGSMEDLNAASLEDVGLWFQNYYGPNNATLVLAGDVDIETAKDTVQRHFGHIPPGPPIARMETWVPSLDQERRMTVEDRVPQSRVYKTWPVPEWGSLDSEWLSLADAVLSQGPNSRLYQRLVYEEQIATDVGGYLFLGEISGAYAVWATAQSGQDLSEVERIMNEEIERFIDDGPTREELDRIITQTRAGLIRGIERVGGFGGKSGILAESAVFGGRPDAYKDSLNILNSVRPVNLRDVAREWLSKNAFVLEVLPFEEQLTASGEDVDRSEPPIPSIFPESAFPTLERTELSNGMQLIVARRDAVPVLQFSLQLNAGYASDQFATPGTANMAMNMLDQGTNSREALDISEELAGLGAQLRTGSNIDYSFVSLSALKENLESSLEIYSDVILNPAFPEQELVRQKRLGISHIQREKTTPMSMALRIFPALIYGEGHAYSLPMTGSGTEEAITDLSRADLQTFHQTWFKPNNATMIVVGDTSLKEIAPILDSLFSNWVGSEIPQKNIPSVALPESSRIVLVDRPGSEQSIIIGGQVVFAKSDERELALQTVNDIFGGSFTSRINMNLREDKAWSYGVRSMLVDTMNQRPFIVYAPVQSDRTADSLAELDRELRELLNDKPVNEEEVDTSKKRSTLTLPGRWETAQAVANDIAQMVRFTLPNDYWKEYAGLVSKVSVQETNAAARNQLKPDQLIWVVVGDLAKIEDKVRALNLGKLSLMDVDGKILGNQ